MRNYLSGAKDYLKNYKAENPRALKLGLMTTGLGLMQGAGQTYDRPVSTVGLMGEAGLKGLGTYEAAREQDIRQKQKGLEEAAKERRYLGGIRAASDLSKAEIRARKGLAEYKVGEAGELAKYRADRAMELEKHRIASRRPDTPAQRLSWAKEQAAKEQAAKDFTTRAGGIVGEFVRKDDAGNSVLDPRLAAAWARAKSLGIDDSAEGLAYLSKAVKFLKAQRKGADKVTDEGVGEDTGKQTSRLSGPALEEQLPTLSVEDISFMETAGIIRPERAQELKKEKLLQQRLAAFMPKKTIIPQTRGTDFYDLSYGRSQRLGEMR